MADNPDEPAQTVRFSDVNQEIEPDTALQHVSTLTGTGEKREEQLSPEAEKELRNLSMTLQKSRCQARRMENFSYEPVSLPASRVSDPLQMSIAALLTIYRHRRPRPPRAPLQAIQPIAIQLVLARLLPSLQCIHPR